MTASAVLGLGGDLLPWVVVIWSVHRARYMTAATSNVDRLALVALGAGALAFALAPIYDAWWEAWKEPLLWGGVIGWCVLPSVRQWIAQHPRTQARLARVLHPLQRRAAPPKG
jgi:hypothetical protein